MKALLPASLFPRLRLTCPAGLVVMSGARLAGVPLDPNAFASLGANPFTQAGTCTIDAVGGRVVRVPPSPLIHSPGKPLKPL